MNYQDVKDALFNEVRVGRIDIMHSTTHIIYHFIYALDKSITINRSTRRQNSDVIGIARWVIEEDTPEEIIENFLTTYKDDKFNEFIEDTYQLL